jgi:large subunit ribosomal protein L10
MKKSEKETFVKKLAEELKDASSMVLVDYAGLTVKAQQELKKRLAKVGAKLSIVKNTLVKIAGKDAKVDEGTLSDSVLAGPTALILTKEDPIAPIQILGKFTQEFEIPQLKVGIVEGKFQDKDSLLVLSKLPSKEVLFSQTIGAISSPIYGIISVLQGNLQKLVYLLNAKIKEQSAK